MITVGDTTKTAAVEVRDHQDNHVIGSYDGPDADRSLTARLGEVSVDTLEEILSESARWNTDWTEKLSESVVDPTETVYHYTDAAALLGILRERELWLHEHTSMNDPTEVRYGVNVALDLIKDRPKLVELLRQGFESTLADMGIFFCCFSLHANDLNQWRNYGANGRGVAIGFSPDIFADKIQARDGRYSTFLMRYCEKEIVEHQTAVIDHLLSLVERAQPIADSVTKPVQDDFYGSLINNAAVSILFNSLFYKHPCYQSEREFRVMYWGRRRNLYDDLNYDIRVRNGELVHYQKIKLQAPTLPLPGRPIPKPEDPAYPHWLREIWVGPAAPQGLKLQIENTLDKEKYPKITVERSLLPYR